MGTPIKRKGQVGIVTSTRMQKTAAVRVERKLPHPRYGKYYKRAKKFLIHDPLDQCNEGDRVRIVACSPISRRKRWRLVEIVERKA